MSARVVHVEIHGQRYALRSELDAQYVGELAAFVDDKMKLAAQELTSADVGRVSILAAMNIADELFRLRSEARGSEGRLLARTAELERLVDLVLVDVHPKAANG